MVRINGVDEIIDNTFGLWISALFHGISVPNPGLSIADQRDAFFDLLKSMIDEGKVCFCPPNELWHENYDVWDADSETIINYLRERWPEGVTEQNDIALENYFYEIPAIIWINSDGSLYSS